MGDLPQYFRSHEMMGRDDTVLVVIDVQEKLIPLIPAFDQIIWNIGRLIDGAKLLEVPVLGTEQYPRGLGATVGELASRTGALCSKLAFSCCQCDEFWQQLTGAHAARHKVLLCGIETHVCVQQTALDLMAAGYRVFLATDAMGTRFEIDHTVGLRRMDSSGATLTTTEAALFELCERAGSPEFKQLSALVRQSPPGITGESTK
jgi:nicotinamidase-related amidase